MLSINDILISDSFIWLYSYSSIVGRRMFCGGNIYIQKTGNAEKNGRNRMHFSLTKGFIALYGYSVIFKTLSPLGTASCVFVKRKQDGLTANMPTNHPSLCLRSWYVYK